MVRKNIINSGSIQYFLQYAIILALLLGMFYWERNLYGAFWIRRFFIIVAGVLSVASLAIFNRALIKNSLKKRILILFLVCSSTTLLLNSSIWSAFFGYPLVHPAIASLLACVSVGLWLSTLNKTRVLQNSYHIIFGWATACFIFWIQGDTSMRVGFIDSQVIYASCLFAIGVMLSIWHYKNKTLNSKYVLGSGIFLTVCLILSQTRSALILVAFYCLWSFRNYFRSRKKLIVPLVILAIVFLAASSVYFSRLASGRYFIRSVEYRASLAAASLPENKVDLLFGGGSGSIEENIKSRGPKYYQLAPDIKSGFRFESSHNYILDLIVERGILVAILFCIIVGLSFHKSWHSKNLNIIQFRTILLFLSFYLFFNNINIQMEVILWLCIMQINFTKSHNG